MNKKTKKLTKMKKADFGDFPPSKECSSCSGRGQVKDDYIVRFWGSSNWTYKKCQSCDGTGKNMDCCLTCGELLNNSITVWCSNRSCDKFNTLVALINKKHENT